MKAKFNILILVAALMLVNVPLSAVENPMLLHVDLFDRSDLLSLEKLHLDITCITEDFAEVVAHSEDLSMLDDAGLHYQIVHEDLVSFYQSRYPLSTEMGGFLTFYEILDTIDALHTNYPALVSARDSIGASWEGRGIWVFKISDNVNIDEDEPEVFYNALIHAREPITWAWQLHYINWLLTNYGSDPVATEIINERELFFLPVFNPDGYEYNNLTYPNGGGMWRKNRRPPSGVDLNRNWGYMWGYDNIGSSPYPDDEDYRGLSPFSELETQVVRDFIISRNFQFILNAHSYSDIFLYPFGYEDIYTPDQSVFQVVGDSAEALTGYGHGTAWELLYNTNGDACDWQYGEQQQKPLIFCAVTETGTMLDGFWPQLYRIPQLNNQMLPLAKYISLVAGNIRSMAPPTAPVINPMGVLYSDTFTVSWTHDDPYNPAVAYELVEKTGFSRFTDDFESGTGNNWQLQGYALSSNKYYSYNHSLFSGSQNNYHGHAALTEPVSVETGDTLVFYIWYDIENEYDYAYVKLSTDGGLIFAPIPGNITTNDDPHGNNRGNGITGSSNSNWVEARFPLDDYVGEFVLIELSYITDGYIYGAGVYIDDIFPIETFSQELILSSNIIDNSYYINGRDNGTYYYSVRAKDAENQWSTFSHREDAVVDVISSVLSDIEIPSDFTLNQNYPNPFNIYTEIAFSLASSGYVRLKIFNVTGKHIRTLYSGKLQTGHHRLSWDGKTDAGNIASSGIYIYKLSTEKNSVARKMTLIK